MENRFQNLPFKFQLAALHPGGGDIDSGGVKVEVAAVLAAVTNLANGNPANQSRWGAAG